MKKIIILIIILTILLGIFLVFNFTKPNTPPQQTSNNAPYGEQNNFENKPNTNKTLANTPTNIDLSIQDQTENNLLSWKQTKTTVFLKNAIISTSNSLDNEAVFEVWKPFIEESSSEIIKILIDENDAFLNQNIFLIFDWYIYLSGFYELLSPEKKQLIARDFAQAQLLVNTNN